jgi:hypothetical protein
MMHFLPKRPGVYALCEGETVFTDSKFSLDSHVRTPRVRRAAQLGRLWRFGCISLLTVIVVGHGCHRGDHDEEPSVAPPHTRADR